MTERGTRDAQIAQIDQMVREVAWSAQKQTTHMLTHSAIDLTLPQMVTLLAIHDSKTCRMSELAEMTQQSAGTLTGIVDRLIDDGLVTRTRNPGDRRVVEVVLTQVGEARLSEAIRSSQDSMRRVLSSFSPDDLTRFERLLHTFLAGLHDDQGGSGGLERVAQA